MEHEAEFHPGWNHWADERYDEAFPLVRTAAERGDASAQCTLGQMYLSGHGCSQDVAAAAEQFASSAAAGASGGQYWYGRCLEAGKGVQQDTRQAYYWYARAAAQDNRLAPFRLAAIYYANPWWSRWLLRLGVPLLLRPAEDQPDWPAGA